MAKIATILSVCECQGRLGAKLSEARHVLAGWALDPRRGQKYNAPCHSMNAQKEYFQLAWLCPLCNRNTLRSFCADALIWQEAPATSVDTGAPNPA
jgi:hypothetical protein